MILSSTLEAIGGTPLVRLRRTIPDGAAQVLVKLEGANPTASYKDRMALAMIEGAVGYLRGARWANWPGVVCLPVSVYAGIVFN